MRRRLATILLPVAALAGLAAAPVAEAASKPAITRVTPMRLHVGDRVTVYGRNFSARRRSNTVIFHAPNGQTAFLKPRRATRRKLVLVVSSSVGRIAKSTTRFRLRVLVRRTFGAWTPRRISPVVVGTAAPPAPTPPSGGTGGGGTTTPVKTPPPPPDCDHDGTPNSTDTDDDNDLLSDSQEASLHTDPCKADTDGDGVDDGFEYKSAVDLNNDDYQTPNQSLPYPGSRPYPNPLDPSDAGIDFDGDSLDSKVEQKLWKFSTTPANRTLFPLTYSAGMQYSVYAHHPGEGDRRFPALAAAGYDKETDFENWAAANGYRYNLRVLGTTNADLFDFNLDGTESAAEGVHLDRDGNGWLSDDERDEDADGLSNFDENSGRMQPKWWQTCYAGDAKETPYYISYAGTDPFNPDSDGDGVRDGADDQDHDDLPNVMELSRIAASGLDDRENGQECKVSKALLTTFGTQEAPIYNHKDSYGRVNPFNPCLPSTTSRTCSRYVTTNPWAPFDQSVNWLAIN